MSISKHKSHNYDTVQMVYWISSVSSKLSAQVQILPARFLPFFPKPSFSLQTNAKKVYLHVFNYIDCL